MKRVLLQNFVELLHTMMIHLLGISTTIPVLILCTMRIFTHNESVSIYNILPYYSRSPSLRPFAAVSCYTVSK